MVQNFFLDESGNSGDAANTGANFDFGNQPIFVLACIGLDERQGLENFIAKLRQKHQIQGAELKSTSAAGKRPDLVQEVLDYLNQEQAPIFIEAVDKKYFLAANIVNTQVLAPQFSPAETHESRLVAQAFADFIYQQAPTVVFETFIAACQNPSRKSLIASFQETRKFAKDFRPISEVSKYLNLVVTENLNDFHELEAREGESAYRQFLPVFDMTKGGGTIFMLPHIASFTGIYARLNRYLNGSMNGVRMFHDEQLQFDEMIQANKKILENLEGITIPSMPHAEYKFGETIPLEFSDSSQLKEIQIADLLAGFVMRYLKNVLVGESIDLHGRRVFKNLLSLANPNTGVGINLVVTAELYHKLHL